MELRVHGIGDHKPLDNQGSPRRVRSRLEEAGVDEAGVELYEAPVPPGHRVRFISWSRSSRSKAKLLWYLAFPYTLLNVAGHMRPARLVWVHHLFVAVAGVFVTLVTWAGIVLSLESLLRYFSLDPTWSIRSGQASAIAAAGLLIAVIWYRAIRHRRRPLIPSTARHRSPLPILASLQGLALLLATWWVCAAVPAQHIGRYSDCWIGSNDEYCVVFRDDVSTRFALIGCGVIALLGLLVALICNAVSRDRTWSGTPADPLLGTALLVVLSTFLVVAGWAALRSAVGWALYYLEHATGFFAIRDFDGQTNQVLRPYDAHHMYGPDMLLGMFTPLILAALVLAAVLFASRKRPRSIAAARFVHRAVCDSSRMTMTLIVVAAIGLLSVPPAIWLWFSASWNRGERDWQLPSAAPGDWTVGVFSGLTVVSFHLGLLAVVLVLVVPSLRKPLASLGDIAGYWDIQWHPLAGLPYRDSVVDLLVAEARGHATAMPPPTEPLVVVGHSQGSVLAFKAIEELGGTGKNRIALITCGSPLQSLYSRYFPTVFNAECRSDVVAGVTSWTNVWRDTDPIGCPLFNDSPPGNLSGAAPRDVHIADPPAWNQMDDLDGFAPGARVHGDYWLDRTQITIVHDLVTETDP